MKLFCLLVLIGSVVAIDSSYNSGYGRLSIEKLETQTEVLENDLMRVAANISDITTLCAVIDDKLNEIDDFFIASQTTENQQQYDIMASFETQVKTLQHKVDDAKALEKQAISLAHATLNSVKDQINDFLNGSRVKGKNIKQQTVIDYLSKQLADCKHDFLYNLTDAISNLKTEESTAEGKIKALGHFVKKRKCEYGFGFLNKGKTDISFKTKFQIPPNVTISFNGYVAHLDKYRHHEDVLSVVKTVPAQSKTGFTVDTYDNSEGQVEVKYVSCSWMACQFIGGEDVYLKHYR